MFLNHIRKVSSQFVLIHLVDKLFRVPLIVSTCLLALAHGSNEVNVSAPSAAMIFLLNPNEDIGDPEAYAGMAIGLASLILGVLTLGKRYLHKYRKKFMKTTLAK
jgi:phosphate/sulfate permease